MIVTGKNYLYLVVSTFIILSFFNTNISVATEEISFQLSEGMPSQNTEKSIFKKRKKKKKNSANKGEETTTKDDSDVDKLLQELGGNYSNTGSAEAQNIKTSTIVESIGNDSNLKSMPYAEILLINKITTKNQNIFLKTGDVKFFGSISIEIHKCINNLNPLKPMDMMLMTIFDNKIDDDKLSIFHGWMLSNNLSASTLEHPVYEVIPVRCHAHAPKDTTTTNNK